MSDLRSVAVIGLGLIGGSVARGLSARGVRILAWDADAATLRAAVDAGVVDHPMDAELAGIDTVDAVILAVPVLAAREMVMRIAPRVASVRLVTDAGSTKRSIARAAMDAGIGARFVGAHPLAGDHRSGWAAARDGLFDGARVFLCPTEETADDAVHLAESLWSLLGGRTEIVAPADHDRRMAWASHLPQAVSTALGAALASTEVPYDALGPGGRSVTRLAGSDPRLWSDVLLDNADEVVPALAAMEAHLAALRAAVEARDGPGIHQIFADARQWHQRNESADG